MENKSMNMDDVSDILCFVRDNRSTIRPERDEDEATVENQPVTAPDYTKNKMLLRKSYSKSGAAALSQGNKIRTTESHSSAYTNTVLNDKPSSTNDHGHNEDDSLYSTVRKSVQSVECKIQYRSSQSDIRRKDSIQKRNISCLDVNISDIDAEFSEVVETCTATLAEPPMIKSNHPKISPPTKQSRGELLSISCDKMPAAAAPSGSIPPTTNFKRRKISYCENANPVSDVRMYNSEFENRITPSSIRGMLSEICNTNFKDLRPIFPCPENIEKVFRSEIELTSVSDRTAFFEKSKTECFSKIQEIAQQLMQHIGEYALIDETLSRWLEYLNLQGQIEARYKEINRLKESQKNLDYFKVSNQPVTSTEIESKLEDENISNDEIDQYLERSYSTSPSMNIVPKDDYYEFEHCINEFIDMYRNDIPFSEYLASEENQKNIRHFFKLFRRKAVKKFLKMNDDKAGDLLSVLEVVLHDLAQVGSRLEMFVVGQKPKFAECVYNIMGEVALRVFSSTRTEGYVRRKEKWLRYLKAAQLDDVGVRRISGDSKEKSKISVISFPTEKNSFQEVLYNDPGHLYEKRKRRSPHRKSSIPSWSHSVEKL